MFKKARIKLSFYYVAIIAIGMIIFSVVFYLYSERDIRHDVSHNTEISIQNQRTIVNHTLDELEVTIIVSNLVILLILSFLSYLLAGKTLDPIREALAAQERFSANASHELRTPLAVMKIENEIFLQEKQPSMETARLLATSNLEEIDRMTGMVQSLLMLARNKTMNQNLEFDSFDFSKLVTDTVSRIEKLHRYKKIDVALSIEPHIEFSGDQKLIEQAIANIIQNAFTYTKEGSIHVSASRDHSHITVSVTDSGMGINQKDLNHVTEPFFKADQSRINSKNSFGLGLSIVSEIVSIHKGTFSIKSTLNQGTVVTITLPII